jgi:Ca2+-binding EF-hand superfamily protein
MIYFSLSSPRVLLALLGCAAAGLALAHPPEHGPRHFAQADTDGDGSVSRAEMLQQRNRHFAELDTDGSGYLDADEFPGRGTGPAAKRLQWHRTKILDLMDLDADGLISADEFAQGPAPMFERADTDGDGYVTTEEVRKLRERHQGCGGHRHRGPVGGGDEAV